MSTIITRFHPDTNNTADEIWKLEQKNLATKDEVSWRMREDCRVGTVRPEPARAEWAPLTPGEFRAKVEDRRPEVQDYTFQTDGLSWLSTAYQSYLNGFFTELGRHEAKLR